MSARLPALAALLLVAGLGVARADDRADAESLFRAGEKAFDAAQYADAADAFEQAYAKLPLPAIAFSMAQAHRLQYFVDQQPHHLQRAVEIYRIYIAEQKTGGRVADAVANLAQIEPLVRDLVAAGTPVAPPPPVVAATRLMVTTDVPKAHVTVDQAAGTAPFVLDVSEGEHTITVSADGYETLTATRAAVPGAMLPVELHLVAKSARVDVLGPAGAEIRIDARHVGEAPARGLAVAAGHHVIELGARGRVPFVRDLELARGATLTLDQTLAKTRQRRAVPVVVLGAGALAIAGGVAAILAHEADSHAQHDRDLLAGGGVGPAIVTDYNRDLSDRSARLHATEIFGAAAGATLVTAALLYVLDHPSGEAPAIGPAIGPTSAGVTVGGHF